MNLLILLMMIIEVISGVCATLYVVITLPVYIIWKIVQWKRTGEPII